MGFRLAVGSPSLDGAFNRDAVDLLQLGDRRFEWSAVAHSPIRLEECALADAK